MIMSASDTVLGTGGPNMVKAAYTSGKPAYGVGAGNSQTIFDPEYDDLAKAVGQTVWGCKFDNGIICACNRSFITPKSISAKIVELMKNEKVYYTDDPAVRDRARQLLFPNGFGAINGKPVGQGVQDIAKMLDLEIPADTTIIVIKVDKYGADEPLCREKMVPLAVHIECEDVKDGLRIAKENLLMEGAGHSSVIHTNNKALAEEAACYLPVSRMLVNSIGQFSANATLECGLVPTATLGCGSWAGCSVSENLGYEHMINITRVPFPYPAEEVPSHEDIWNGNAEF